MKLETKSIKKNKKKDSIQPGLTCQTRDLSDEINITQ